MNKMQVITKIKTYLALRREMSTLKNEYDRNYALYRACLCGWFMNSDIKLRATYNARARERWKKLNVLREQIRITKMDMSEFKFSRMQMAAICQPWEIGESLFLSAHDLTMLLQQGVLEYSQVGYYTRTYLGDRWLRYAT